MKQISIYRNGQLTNQASFETDEELNQWFEKHKNMGSFGRCARYEKQTIVVKQAEYAEGEPILVKDAVLDEEGNELEPALYEVNRILVSEEETEEVDVLVEPAEFTFEVSDLTEKLEQERINAEARAYLASTDWYVVRQAESGAPIPTDILYKRAEARAKVIDIEEAL